METAREQANLLGQVQEVYLETSEFIKKGGKWVEKARSPFITIKYNVDGDIIGEIIHCSTYTKSSSASEDNVVSVYDEEGGISEQSHYLYGVLQDKMIFSYDALSRVTNILICGSDGEPIYQVVEKYDLQGNIIEKSHYKLDGSLKERFIYTNAYDATGNWIKVVIRRWTNRDGKPIYEPTMVTYRTIVYY